MQASSYDWLIVGGGIHGVTIANFLLQYNCVDKPKLLIVDPNEELLLNWTQRAQRVGMKTLRSSVVHHIDVDPFSLKKFASTSKGRSYGRLRGKYARPDLALFDAHSESVIEQNSLQDLKEVDRVLDIKEVNGTELKEVVLSKKTVYSKNIVLALGNPEPLVPKWANKLNAKVLHVFAPSCSEQEFKECNIAIIGGGLSAAQVALKSVREKFCTPTKRVKVFSRHSLRKTQFDSEPGWMGPKYRSSFEKIKCPISKREKINTARHRGSVTPEVLRDFNKAVRNNEVELEILENIDKNKEENLCDCLNDFDVVVLATGFEKSVPNSNLVKRVSKEFKLELTPCGVPMLKDSIYWGQGIYTSGALAEMRIGPIARNIPGARSVAREIVYRMDR